MYVCGPIIFMFDCASLGPKEALHTMKENSLINQGNKARYKCGTVIFNF